MNEEKRVILTKYARLKTAYTEILKISNQKDVEINKLKALLIKSRMSSERFDLQEFQTDFTAEQLKQFTSIQGSARFDTKFVRSILEVIYEGQDIPTLRGPSMMLQDKRNLLTSMLEKRINHFSQDNEELDKRLHQPRIAHILSDTLLKLRKEACHAEFICEVEYLDAANI